jgi:hypothetical protein
MCARMALVAIGNHVQRHPARLRESRPRAPRARQRRDRRVVLRDRVGRRRELRDERPEAERREERVAALARGAAVAERLEVERHGTSVRICTISRLCRACIRVRQQRLAVLLLRHVGRVREQRVERTVRGDQIAGALLADAGHALDVVGRIAHQREHVHHLLRRHAELLDDPRRVEPRALVARVVDADGSVATSWKKSLSPVTIATGSPASAACFASVPITSSASKPAE